MIQSVATISSLPQHIVLDEISWPFYEALLAELGDRQIRVAYDEGRLEIMSPLPEHERIGNWVGRLLETMALERSIDLVGLGSTTFRYAAKKKGLEPDECYYVQHAAAAREIEGEFDLAIHPPPDLAIEVEVTRKAIAREPIYAALGVPELWRISHSGIRCAKLSSNGTYQQISRSIAFPFLTPDDLMEWGSRLSRESSLIVLREFQIWVQTL